MEETLAGNNKPHLLTTRDVLWRKLLIIPTYMRHKTIKIDVPAKKSCLDKHDYGLPCPAKMEDYWPCSPHLQVPIILFSAMYRNRFDTILCNLHVNDNQKIPDNNKDKIYRLKPVIEGLNNVFHHAYHGSRELAVGETMVLFKGRTTMKLYNPKKPIKRGFKIWTILVFSEKFFTSLKLLDKLKSEKILACGPIRNRRRILQLAENKLERGDSDCRHSNTELDWNDTVCVLASKYHGSEIKSVSRRMHEGTKQAFRILEL
ncbi:hypothetical protein PR048_029788 [Dryococelus australis]|uniref:PiggyBac transposable element-derived protein domain-containing protein n=1 Tax=Dryococelus australis TaxID=614101 RepID=A0ABQ9G9W5_9NEOP|nr:hypothetical protein PR048_029788 [Dryococelus australis]